MTERRRGSAPKQKPTGERTPAPDRRLLPSDFRKYLALSQTEKKLSEPSGRKGFIQLTKNIKGKQDIGIKDFLAFYFDSKEDYEVVKRCFEIHSHATAHPILDEKKLADMVRKNLER